MNIIFCGTDDQFVALHSALKYCGINTKIWAFDKKPINDMIYEQKPDVLFIKSSLAIDEYIAQAINSSFIGQVVVYGKPMALEIKPDLWCIADDIPEKNLEYISADCPKMVLRRSANLAQMAGGVYSSSLQSDALYISSKSDISPVILNTVSQMNNRFLCIGNVRIPIPEYIGNATLSDCMNYMTSTKVNLDVDRHILLNAAANRVFTVSNTENKFFPFFNDVKELPEMISSFGENEKARRKITKKAYNKVFDEDHTYFHRLIEIGKQLDIDWEPVCREALNKVRT